MRQVLRISVCFTVPREDVGCLLNRFSRCENWQVNRFVRLLSFCWCKFYMNLNFARVYSSLHNEPNSSSWNRLGTGNVSEGVGCADFPYLYVASMWRLALWINSMAWMIRQGSRLHLTSIAIEGVRVLERLCTCGQQWKTGHPWSYSALHCQCANNQGEHGRSMLKKKQPLLLFNSFECVRTDVDLATIWFH